MKIMKDCGIHVVESPADIGKVTLNVLNSKNEIIERKSFH